jgi:hypothetical protein
MCTRDVTAIRYVAVAALLALALAACGEATKPHTPTTTPTARLDDRLEDAAATVTASAGAPRFNGEILGLYIAPSIDDWPQVLHDEYARMMAARCVDEPTGQSELDFMQPLTLPSGFEPAGYLESTGKPEVVACGGRTTGLSFEYRKTNGDAAPATIVLSRGVGRAETFDAAASDVSARTIGARQAIVIAPAVAGAPTQRSMVLFPEDFGATIVHAFNVPHEDLLAFAASVATASAPYWEKIPSGLGAEHVARVCAEIPAGATSDHGAFGLTDDGRTSEMIFNYPSTALVLYPGDALDDCPEQITQSLAYAHDPALYDVARTWVASQRGELAGECATRPLIPGRDRTLADWCYYRPRSAGEKVVLSVGRPQFDYAVDLVMRRLDGGGYELLDVVTPPAADNWRFWYFEDEHAVRWSTYEGAAAYRLKARLVAFREHAPDPCAAPPLAEETREITLDETLPPAAHLYHLNLPDLPPEDAWWVAISGDGTVRLQALDPNGDVIAETGTTWVRDLFCVRPRR